MCTDGRDEAHADALAGLQTEPSSGHDRKLTVPNIGVASAHALTVGSPVRSSVQPPNSAIGTPAGVRHASTVYAPAVASAASGPAGRVRNTIPPTTTPSLHHSTTLRTSAGLPRDNLCQRGGEAQTRPPPGSARLRLAPRRELPARVLDLRFPSGLRA